MQTISTSDCGLFSARVYPENQDIDEKCFCSEPINNDLNRGIKHDFLFINIRKVPKELLKTEGDGACEC